jgi:hypothetical protein
MEQFWKILFYFNNSVAVRVRAGLSHLSEAEGGGPRRDAPPSQPTGPINGQAQQRHSRTAFSPLSRFVMNDTPLPERTKKVADNQDEKEEVTTSASTKREQDADEEKAAAMIQVRARASRYNRSHRADEDF